jgi:hypothetical protein
MHLENAPQTDSRFVCGGITTEHLRRMLIYFIVVHILKYLSWWKLINLCKAEYVRFPVLQSVLEEI